MKRPSPPSTSATDLIPALSRNLGAVVVVGALGLAWLVWEVFIPRPSNEDDIAAPLLNDVVSQPCTSFV